MDIIEIVVQINGKVRAKFPAVLDTDEETLKRKALDDENVKRQLDGKHILKIVVVKNKLISLAVK